MRYVLFVTIGLLLAVWLVSKTVQPKLNFAQNTAEWNQLHQLNDK